MHRTMALVFLLALAPVGAQPTPIVSQTPRSAEIQEADRAVLTVIEERLQEHPDNPEYYHARGSYRRELLQYKEACQDFLKALQLDPGNPRYLNELAWTLCLRGEHRSAYEYAEKAVQANERVPEAQQESQGWRTSQANCLDTRAAAAMGLRNYPQAGRDLKRALALHPSDEIREHQKLLEKLSKR